MSYSKLALLVASALMAVAANAGDYKAGEVIVKYKDGAVRSRSSVNELYNAAGVKTVRRFKGIMKGLEQLTLADNVKVQDAIAALQKDPSVEYAQPNYMLYALPIKQGARRMENPPGMPGGAVPCIPGFDIPGCDPNAKLPCLIPGVPFPPGCDGSGGGGGGGGDNPPPPSATRPELQDAPADVNPPVADPELSKAYGLGKVGAVEAWTSFRGSKDMLIADIDTGIDYNHEDLAFNVWRNPKPSDKKDIVGFDFIHNDGLPFDDNEHGTHTAGTIGAVGGNGKGVSGVAQRVSIMALKFLTGEGSGTTADAVRAIDYAVEHGAKVLSNSWGGKGDDGNAALEEAIKRAAAKGVLFVAAAGNDGTDNDKDPTFPASFKVDNMITVAATDASDKMAFFSNYGKDSVHLAAPGVNVYSTVPGNKYMLVSGTSMACPHVAGAAALLWAQNPKWDYKKVKAVLFSTVDKLPELSGKTVTGGRLNVLNALRSKD